MTSDEPGCLRCDQCAELVPAEEIKVCEECGSLFCLHCEAKLGEPSSYEYCKFCCP